MTEYGNDLNKYTQYSVNVAKTIKDEIKTSFRNHITNKYFSDCFKFVNKDQYRYEWKLNNIREIHYYTDSTNTFEVDFQETQTVIKKVQIQATPKLNELIVTSEPSDPNKLPSVCVFVCQDCHPVNE